MSDADRGEFIEFGKHYNINGVLYGIEKNGKNEYKFYRTEDKIKVYNRKSADAYADPVADADAVAVADTDEDAAAVAVADADPDAAADPDIFTIKDLIIKPHKTKSEIGEENDFKFYNIETEGNIYKVTYTDHDNNDVKVHLKKEELIIDNIKNIKWYEGHDKGDNIVSDIKIKFNKPINDLIEKSKKLSQDMRESGFNFHEDKFSNASVSTSNLSLQDRSSSSSNPEEIVSRPSINNLSSDSENQTFLNKLCKLPSQVDEPEVNAFIQAGGELSEQQYNCLRNLGVIEVICLGSIAGGDCNISFGDLIKEFYGKYKTFDQTFKVGHQVKIRKDDTIKNFSYSGTIKEIYNNYCIIELDETTDFKNLNINKHKLTSYIEYDEKKIPIIKIQLMFDNTDEYNRLNNLLNNLTFDILTKNIIKTPECLLHFESMYSPKKIKVNEDKKQLLVQSSYLHDINTECRYNDNIEYIQPDSDSDSVSDSTKIKILMSPNNSESTNLINLINNPYIEFRNINNLQCTCYLDSTLQMLIQNKYFCMELIIQSKKFPNNEKISILIEIMKKIYLQSGNDIKDNKIEITEEDFNKLVKGFDGNFSSYINQQDANEFYVKLIESLHNNENLHSRATENISNDKELFLNNILFCCTSYEQCINCNNNSLKKLEEIYTLTLLIPDNDNDKNINKMFYDYFQDGETISNCICGNNKKKIIKKKPVRYPMYFYIHVLRFKKEFNTQININEKNNSKIECPLIWNRDEFSNNGFDKFQYILSGFILHTGGSRGGHYIYYGKNEQTGKWYEYNDSSKNIQEKSEDRIKNIVQDAYILYYKKQYI